VGRVRVAEWLDRAEAAAADAEEIALRDLRAVVTSADDVARDESTRELATRLREVLDRRSNAEQSEWLQDLTTSLEAGRVVRALRLSSRPPQPGEAVPAELTTKLGEAASAAMTAEIAPDRWATLLDAVAYSPVRRAIVPAGAPAEPGDDLLAMARKHAGRVPAAAKLFGIEPPPPPASKRAPKPKPRPEKASRPPLPPLPGGGRRIPPPPVAKPGPAPTAPPDEVPATASADSPEPHGDPLTEAPVAAVVDAPVEAPPAEPHGDVLPADAPPVPEVEVPAVAAAAAQAPELDSAPPVAEEQAAVEVADAEDPTPEAVPTASDEEAAAPEPDTSEPETASAPVSPSTAPITPPEA
jgi:hypothetical protein